MREDIYMNLRIIEGERYTHSEVAMKKVILILALAVLVLFSISMIPGTTYARDGHWGGHGGGHWEGHGGGHWGGGIWIGPGWGWGPWWNYPYYPYYPDYPYYPEYYSPAIEQQEPPSYEQHSPRAQDYWYFCTSPEGYYPYIKKCPSGWLKVVPSSVQPPSPPPPASEREARVLDRLTIHVNFEFGKSNLTKADEADLRKAVDFISKYRGTKVELDGYTDNKGTEQYNQKLSEKRAEAVKQYLIKEGAVDKTKISSKGYGESRPIAPNKTKDGKDNPEGRAKNRRVEILIISE
jgi:outer membrane protein OmpA-like peptidoglycan-associated protein